MNVTLIGMGSGQPENLTLQGLAALRQADLILGARRLLAVLPAGCTENRAAAYRPDEVAELLQTSGAENAVLVYSGDTGFYSGASAMMEKLEALGVRARVLPGLSSIQLLAAALGRPWQGWNLVSAHGRTCDPVAECMQGRPTFFLTGGSEDPATRCAQLAAEGLRTIPGVHVWATPDLTAQAGVVSFTADGWDVEEMAGALGEWEIAVRAGLHCAPLAHRTVGTLESGTVRLSFSAMNTPAEVCRFLAILRKLSRG